MRCFFLALGISVLAFPALAATPVTPTAPNGQQQGFNTDGSANVKEMPYVYTALGCGQLSAFSASTLLSSVSGGIPSGATLASLSIETNTIRYRDDGTAPTSSVGTPLYTGLSSWPYSGPLTAIRFIPTTGSATVDVCFYR